MARVTIDRTVFSKLTTQLNKPSNRELASELERTKSTLNPQKGVVLWEPEPDLVTKVADVLHREQGFMRKKNACTFKLMTENIARLRAYVTDYTK